MNYNGLINHGDFRRIKKVMEKALNGEEISTIFLGGSITQGSLSSTPELCYAYRVYSWWCEKFPMAKISFFNAGIGGTTSQFGVSRVEDHVLIKKPDFLLVEFAVNDEDTDFFKETYEGLIRRILRAETSPAVLLMNNAWYDTGKNAERIHLDVARHYNLPMVSMKSTIFDAISKGEMESSSLSPDMLHPNDAGHEKVASVIINALEQIYDSLMEDKKTDGATDSSVWDEISNEAFDNVESDTEVSGIRNCRDCALNARGLSNCVVSDDGMVIPPLTLNRYENSVRIKNYNMEDYGVVLDGFTKDEHEKREFLDIFAGGFEGRKVGDSIEFVANCTGIAIQYKKTIHKPAPIAYAVIDNDEENKIILDANFDEDWGDCLYIETVAQGLELGEHRVKITIDETHEDDASTFYLVSVIASC